MYLVDSNVIVYSYLAQYEHLIDLLYRQQVFVSEISRVEVLGYHKLSNEEEIFFNRFFKFIPIKYPDKQIFDAAIKIRRQYNLKLGDSIIAAPLLW